MEQKDLRELLERVSGGALSVDEAMLRLREAPFLGSGFEDIGFAKVDCHRAVRQGIAEVIYGAGKTPWQMAEIVKKQLCGGQKTILITRLLPEAKDRLLELLKSSMTDDKIRYDEVSRTCIIGDMPPKDGIGKILVVTAGTSDIPVAEEAAITAEAFGNETVRLYDVGVAGLHRLLGYRDEIMSARVIIAIAGMEGALASVIGGLVDVPVIAVPASVGYGASFGGLAALLSMLNSCAGGVSVVNIDNGFGAGYLASMINHMEGKKNK